MLKLKNQTHCVCVMWEQKFTISNGSIACSVSIKIYAVPVQKKKGNRKKIEKHKTTQIMFVKIQIQFICNAITTTNAHTSYTQTYNICMYADIRTMDSQSNKNNVESVFTHCFTAINASFQQKWQKELNRERERNIVTVKWWQSTEWPVATDNYFVDITIRKIIYYW